MKNRKALKQKPSKDPKRGKSDSEAPAPRRCPVVGFGASAGGLEAFQEILASLPGNTGLAFVFVQHLDPKHTSLLGELLSKATPMPVLQVTDQMPVEANKVYVIPPNVGMRLAGGKLRLTERSTGGLHLPIDEFFRSLAEDQGSRAIAVILSGTASDGTLGLRAIKEAGGITFAQDQTAKFDAMPRNAIAAGGVDLVMPPNQIAHEIVRICGHPYVTTHETLTAGRPAGNGQTAARPGRFEEILNLLRASTGVDFTMYKPGTPQRRILRRMALHKAETTDQYLRLLRENRNELKALFHDILISVTGFFRESATFDALNKLVLPNIFHERSAEAPVRVWVAGCSTGEEAYSIAICLLEYMRELDIEVPVQIFGTDLSEAALERARAGVYPEAIAANVSPERLRRFFSRVDGQYQISRPVRDLCIFAQQNLSKDPPFSNLDLIMCRNVLIYLGPALQTRVLRLFHYGLKQTGYLVLGLSETVGNSTDLFTPLERNLKIYSRVPGSAVANPLEFGSREDLRMEGAGRRPAPVPSTLEAQRRVDQYLLSRYSPPGALITEDGAILQFRGQTAPFLEHAAGEPALNIARMLRPDLLIQFRKVFDRARKSRASARGDRIRIEHLGRSYAVRVCIYSMLTPGETETQYLVLFEAETGQTKTEARETRASKQATAPSRRARELEEELASTKQYLESLIEEQQATTEELKSANEEVQSSNEELQSTNEELLTAKEELQSTNEELVTVNEEMNSRNAELSLINNDLNNLLSSVNIPIVMLGNDLRIRRFTPQAEKVLNLLPTDVGRPVSDFKPKIDIPDLEDLFLDVIENLHVKEREVRDREGRWFSMWVRPYRTTENKILGAVMVLFDITERKEAGAARYRRLFEGSKDGILIADAETGAVIDLNPYVTNAFGVPRASSIGRKYWDLDLFRGTELDASTLTDLHENKTVQKFVSARLPGGEGADLEIIGNVYPEGERRAIQLNIRDITERKRLEETAHRLQPLPRIESIGRLAGSVAQDFGTLLGVVSEYTETLKQRFGQEDLASNNVGQISQALERAGLLARQLMILSGRRPPQVEVLNLNSLISDMEPIARTALPNNIQLKIERSTELRPVKADRGQLEQVILNLALNAQESMPAGGALSIRTYIMSVDTAYAREHPAVKPGEYTVLEISDSGYGLNYDPQGDLSEPVVTAGRQASGLSEISSIASVVQQFGGCVWAASEFGRGTTFRIFLPQVAD